MSDIENSQPGLDINPARMALWRLVNPVTQTVVDGATDEEILNAVRATIARVRHLDKDRL